MTRRMVARDLRRGVGASAVLFGFFLVAALLACSGAGAAARLLGAVDRLFAAAAAPDVVQMSVGEVDEQRIAEFAASRSDVEDYLVSKAAVATGDALWFGDSARADSSSVMEHYFVAQNRSFDLLLGLDNKPVHVEPGQIGVPVYDMLRHGLRVGDRIEVKTPAGEMSLVIASFVRDAQMNPAMITSKRFAVASADLDRLAGLLASWEYLIEFRLSPGTSTAAFMDDYREAGLPRAGPSVDAGLLRAVAFLGDGPVVVVLLLVSLLLLIIGIVCLRFAVVSAIAASYRELGAMRAIGAPLGFMRRVFSAKYIVLAAAGCLLGWVGALILVPRLTRDALRYTGPPDSPAGMLLVAGLVGGGLFAIVAISCWLAVRAVGKVSATQALRDGTMGVTQPGRWRRWSLLSSRAPVAWYLGMRDLQLRPRSYIVPMAVFAIAAFLLVVPVNFLSTANSPTFVQYMGIGLSETRLDAPVSGGDSDLPAKAMARVVDDPRIGRAADSTTYRCSLLPATGEEVTSLVETGDFETFPIAYLEGRTPAASGELALSYLNADELAASLGDTLELQDGTGWRSVRLVGIYQDITNGGKTAKVAGDLSCGEPIWVTISFDSAPGADPAQIVAEFNASFEGVRAYSMGDYSAQTFGQALRSLGVAVRASLAVSTAVAALIAAMFTAILLARDAGSNAVLRTLGARPGLVRNQYLIRLLTVLVVGVAIGTALASTAGEAMVGALMSILGAPDIAFSVNPLVSYVACPGALILAVAFAIAAASHTGANPRTDPTQN